MNQIQCDQCNAVMINGTFCHEAGCTNEKKTFNHKTGEWESYYVCRYCGYPVLEGTICECEELID